ncbi:MAG: Ig-like domain-containing protein [bacterium]|nr:Ig-like domain-containing protein [bacterium]
MLRKAMVLNLAFSFLLGIQGVHGAEQPAWVGDHPENKPLEITAARPTGVVREPVELTVKFNQPMVKLEKVAERLKGLEDWVIIEPKPTGAFHWLGTDTLVYRPENPFPLSTRYQVTVKAGFKSAFGNALARDYSFTFDTDRIRVRSAAPGNGSQSVQTGADLRVWFDQTFDPAVLQEYFTLRKSRGETVPVTIVHLVDDKSDEDHTSAWIKLSEELEPKTSYSVRIGRDFHGDQGPLAMGSDHSYSFRTHDPLRVTDDGTGEYCRNGINLRFNNQVEYKDLDANLVIVPEVPFTDASYYSTGALLDPEATYDITVKKGLTDVHGNALPEDYNYTLTTTPLSPDIRFFQSYSGLEASGPHRLPMYVRNVKGFDLYVERFEDPMQLAGKQWPREAPSGVPKTRVPLDPRPIKTTLYGLDMDPYMPAGSNYGVFRLTFEEPRQTWCGWRDWKTGQLTPRDLRASAIVQVTDMALSGKVAVDRSLLWVTDLSTGAPIPGVDVTLFDRGGAKLGEAKTGPDGVAEFSVGRRADHPAPVASNRSRPRDRDLVFVARNGQDTAYLEHGSRGRHNAWSFGVTGGSGEIVRLMGYLFTERAVYRPGEDAYFKGWVRTRTPEGLTSLAGNQVDLKVTDRKGAVIHETTMVLSEFGGLDGKVSIPKNVPLGQCTITATLPDSGGSYRAFFDVKEYRVPEFEVVVENSMSSYVVGDEFSARVAGKYLFGGSMNQADARWSLRMTPAWITPPNYKGYIFANWAPAWEQGEEDSGPLSLHSLLSEGQGKLSPDGILDILHSLGPAKRYSDYSVTLEATVTDVNRQQISGRSWAEVHAAEYKVGLKTSARLLEAGKTLKLDLVAADYKGKLVPGREAEIKLVRREWHSIRREGVGGWWEYESKPEDTVVESRKVTLADGKGHMELNVPRTGEYFLGARSTDDRGNITASSTRLWAWGGDYVPWRRTNDTKIDLVPDKESYEPGDTAKILVKNPLGSCNALLTIERESVIERKLLRLEGSAPVLEIPIGEKHIPNLYVSLVMVSGRTGEQLDEEGADTGRPTYKAGYASLPVSTDSRRLTVALNAPPDARPGDTVEVKVFVTEGQFKPVRADVTLMAVDVGVLNLTGYETPDPLDYFWAPAGLGVTFSTSLDYLLSRMNFGMKGKNAGGGGKGEAALARLRGTFLTTPLFLPSVVTDSGTGTAAVKFKLPDNLTRYRIMAVAADWKEKFGSGERNLTVNLPLMIQPSLPRFASVSDKFRSGVVIHNQSGSERDVMVTLKGEGIEISDSSPRRVLLPDGGSSEVLFDMKAKVPGTAALEFAASSGDLGDRARYTFPVKIPHSKEVVAAYGVVSEEGTEMVGALENVYTDIGGLSVAVGSTALSGLEEAVDTLINYPYGCLEQQLSRLVPLVAARDIIRAFGIKSEKVDMDKIDESVAEYTSDIPLFQKGSGALMYWKDSPWASPYLSAYCLDYLLRAAVLEEAAAVELLADPFTQRLVAYMEKLLKLNRQRNRKYSEQEVRDGFYNISLAQEAYVCWLLARHGKADVSHNNDLWKIYSKAPNSFGITGRLFLLAAIAHVKGPDFQVEALGKDIDRLVTETAKGAYIEDILRSDDYDWYLLSSRTVHTAIALDILSRYLPDSVSIPKMVRYLVQSRVNGRWRTTHEGARSLMALVTYYRTFEADPPDYSYKVALDREDIQRGEFRERTMRVNTTTVPMSVLREKGDADLTFAKEGRGLLYYGAHLSYYPTARDLPPMDEGFRVERIVEPLNGGEPSTSYEAGAQLKVTLRVTTAKPRFFVVIEDPLPAGVEAMDTSLKTASQEAVNKSQGQKTRSSDDWGYWTYWYHVTSEVRDDRVLVFIDTLYPGTFEYVYVANALHHGDYNFSPTRAEEMYTPETFGRGEGGRFEVR